MCAPCGVLSRGEVDSRVRFVYRFDCITGLKRTMLFTIVRQLWRQYTVPVFFVSVIGITPGVSLAQSIVDITPDTTLSIHAALYMDSIESAIVNRLDTARLEFDSVMRVSGRKLHFIESTINHLKDRFDSIRLVPQVDSVLSWRDQRLMKISDKTESLRHAIKTKLDSLPLPPELSERADQIMGRISSLQTPLANELQSNMRSIGNLLPGVSERIKTVAFLGSGMRGVADLQNVDALANSNLLDISGLEQRVPDMQLGTKIHELQVESVSQTAQQQLLDSNVASSVQEQVGEGNQLLSAISTAGDEEAMRQQLLEKAQHEATDYFKGKTEQLDRAISSIAKHKARIPSVASLNDIPKRAPNEMRERPFVERLVPGVALQLLNKDDLVTIDFNVYSGYRFTKRLTVGIGWNERVGLNTKAFTLASGDVRIYGPRVFGAFKLPSGFEPRLDVEAMNTFIPPYFRSSSVDPGSRSWIIGAFAGISKTYSITKHVKGTAMVMVRLFDPNRTSPYPDVISARFGLEVPLKQRTSTK